ncbi:hypothetical protein L2E82_38269 [Cichorium intybus]|uniref:Uncharacterized protein n=1 Tax=Cichorium intybus TaxID=13427 RepID=A0ACB9AK40_CICIN|nr:hypothetical protein L2E82_38269 [Cichorium intybus]
MEDSTPTKGTTIENQTQATKSIHLDGEEIKETTELLTEKLVGEVHNRSVESKSPKYDLMHCSPNPSPKLNHLNTPYGLLVDNSLKKAQAVNIEEETTAKTPPKGLSAEVSLETTQFENKEEEKVANTLNRTEFSGKLIKLLSRNLSIAEKLEGEDKATINYNKDFTGMEKNIQVQDNKKIYNQHQIEQRITRNQLRLMEENKKRRTRANYSITYSGNSSTSITVAQRLEEVGTICGMKKGNIGSKHINNCSRKGAYIGNQ